MKNVVTRFAPSPTGRLHLGHAYSALLAHDFARDREGMFLLRIEDIDPARKRTEFVDGIIGDLLWLGLEPDGEIVYQSERLSLYADALERLKEQGLARSEEHTSELQSLMRRSYAVYRLNTKIQTSPEQTQDIY